MSDGQTWGVFGGSFNPPHIGHQLLVQGLLARGVVDRILVVPCYQHAFGKDLCSLSLRCHWLSEMFEHDPRVEICGLEASLSDTLGHAPRSLELLEALAQREPSVEFRWIVGQDIIDSGETARWYRWSQIEANFRPLVVPRAGYSSQAWLPQISSTELRSAWQDPGRRAWLEPWLPKVVARYRDEGGTCWPPQASHKTPEPVWVLGQGKAGRALVAWLRAQGVNAQGFSARSLLCDEQPLNRLCQLHAPQMIWLATRKQDNAALLRRIFEAGVTVSWVVASEGAYSANDLDLTAHCPEQTRCASLHPICSLAGFPHTLQRAYFGWSGAPEFGEMLRGWLGESRLIDLNRLDEQGSHGRLAYHAACALSCNYLGALWSVASRRCAELGLDPERSRAAIAELMRGAKQNLRRYGLRQGASGALLRGQEKQVQCHQSQWQGVDAALHAALVDAMRKALSECSA